MTYLLLTMGGTIDAAPYPQDGTPFPADIIPDGQNRACAALRKMTPVLDCIAICDKDSKLIHAQDLQTLAIYAQTKGYSRIIVTMGTDRMPEVARDIKARGLNLACPVVFTGAFMPLSNGSASDGEANLRKAAFERSELAPGVYIAAGDLFDVPDGVYKDFENRVFLKR